jgi:hypothetical protein
VDKSTGKQVTTKARGNFVGITFDGSLNNDGSGRLLEGSLCHATFSMSDNDVERTVFELRRGVDLYFGTVDNSGDGDHGQVDYVAGHHEYQQLSDFFNAADSFDFEFPFLHFDNHEWDVFIQENQETMCNIYAHVACTVTHETCNFILMCCGTVEEALFTTGATSAAPAAPANCCLVHHDANRRLAQLERRLGKCSQ